MLRGAARAVRADAGRCCSRRLGQRAENRLRRRAGRRSWTRWRRAWRSPAWRSSSTRARWRYEQVAPARRHGARRDQLRRRAQPRGWRLPARGAQSASALPRALGVPAAARCRHRRDRIALWRCRIRSTAAHGTSSPRTSACSMRWPRCSTATSTARTRCSTRRTHRSATTSRCRCRRSTCSSRLAEAGPVPSSARDLPAAVSGDRSWRWSARKPPRVAARVVREYPAARFDATVLVPTQTRPSSTVARTHLAPDDRRKAHICDGFRRAFVLPSLPMPAQLPGRNNLNCCRPVGRRPARSRSPGQADRRRARAGAHRGAGAIWRGPTAADRPDIPTAGSRPSGRCPPRRRAMRRGPTLIDPRLRARARVARHRAALHAPGRGDRARARRPQRRRHHADRVGQDALLQRAGPDTMLAGPVERARCICFRPRRSRRISSPSCTS